MQIEQFQWSADEGWQPHPPPGSLGSSAQLALIFFSPRLAKNPACYDAVRNAYPGAHLFGCSTGGQVQGAEVRDDSAAVTAISFEGTRVETRSVAAQRPDSGYDAGQELARSLDPGGLRCLFLLSEGIKVNANDAVDGIHSVLPEGVALFGGCASNAHNLEDTYVVCDAPPEPNRIGALAFYGDRLKVGMGSSSGWDQFGLDRLITRSKKNVLYEFDGLPALPLYKKYIGAAAEHLPSSAMLFPLRLRIGNSPHGVLRGVLAVDEREQSITFAGNVPEGSQARLMFGSKEHLIDGAIVAAQGMRQAMGSCQPQLSIVVSCVARMMVLKSRTAEELESFRDVLGDSFPMTGFYALGEVGPGAEGGRSDFHNETLTAAGLVEV